MELPSLSEYINELSTLFEAQDCFTKEPEKFDEERKTKSELLKKRIDDFSKKSFFSFDEDKNGIDKLNRQLQNLNARHCNSSNDLYMIPITQSILAIYLKKGEIQMMVDILDVSTFDSGSIFWSGYHENPSESAQRAAENYMYHNDLRYTNLERTAGGRTVNGWEPLNISEHYNEFWSLLSEKYASSAMGTATLVLSPDAISTRGRIVWKRYELPALVNNIKVTQVVVLDLDGNIIETWDKQAMSEENERNMEEFKQQDIS